MIHSFSIHRALLMLLALPILAGTFVTDARADALFARGKGMLAYSGAGQIEISCSGFLIIYQNGDEAQIDVDSSAAEVVLENGGRLFADFAGSLSFFSDDVTIICGGANIMLRARGDGNAVMAGAGYYMRGLELRFWSSEGVAVSLAEE
ncbi:MAG: hypothetical protein GY868_14630 [Deltaproteobacteria bacterium]|nr:hypothetical protein [Deltaproteobacteria bacterium]